MAVKKFALAFVCLLVAVPRPLEAQETKPDTLRALTGAVSSLYELVQPATGERGRAISLELAVREAKGVPKELLGSALSVHLQAPDRLKVTMQLDGTGVTIGRNGEQIWIHVPQKKLALLGLPEVPRFTADPQSTATVKLDSVKLPGDKAQIAFFGALLNVGSPGTETVAGRECLVLRASPQPAAREALGLPDLEVTAWLATADQVPARLALRSGDFDVTFDVVRADAPDPAPADDFWQLPAADGTPVTRVALAHLTGFLSNFVATLTNKIPALGPVTGERRLVATEGNGRLEMHDGTRVLVLQGTPEEMGRQHGVLLKKEIRSVTDRILYGVGVGSSLDKGRWFFGEIEEAQARLLPHMNPRYLREADALAQAAGLHPQESRLANFFPELFHCSGFALHGSAVAGGRLFHGRVLDYLKGMGLEQNAVVIVQRPEKGNAWVNCGYAGFVGSVTAMNEKHLAIGEMGGRGEGNWDGKPMAHLMREVMETCDTIDQAVALMQSSKRTCEYYYVISDAKTMRACGIKATPSELEVIWSGESHPQLPEPVKDAVLMSAGDRYKELVRRVKAGTGTFTAETARALMEPPVCMGSNIQSVLFAPDTLDFWVANADSANVASRTRYTHYNLRQLLDSPPAPAR